ncbi:hypothetical protein [Azomonas macrocytogenes]|uniref:Gas vesicle protein n=1 Tax=Azomonas macrocytogenes TaxID=69962 RepID=A0A839T005_AZOMA|nr:hypothetical protein [Azomonas macrocytogenes]MBB3101774.1 hypothetical protein [Azomonas macrocytogenes]
MKLQGKEPSSGMDTPIGKSDWFIQNLVFLAKSGIELPVTLNTTGGIVSGTIISGENYLDLLSARAREAGIDNPAYRELGDWFDQYMDVLANDDAEGDGPHFIHLRDATLVTPTGITSFGSDSVWRGRIRAITGLTFSRL